MANINVARSTGDLFPVVAVAVDQYRLGNPGKEARTLARGLSNEEILYRHFVEKLLLLSSAWPSPDSAPVAGGNRARLDRQRLDSLNRDLSNTGEALMALKAELSITSRGSEVLSRLKPKTNTLRPGQTQSSLLRCLNELSKYIQRLTSYLPALETRSLPYVAEYHGSLDFRMTIERDSVEPSTATKGIKVTGTRHTCFCEKTPQEDRDLSSYSGSSASDRYTPPSTSNSEAALDNLQFPHVSVAARSIASIPDHPSFLLDDFSNKLDRSRSQYEVIGGGSIPLSVQQSADIAPMSLRDLLDGGSAKLDQRMRLEVAFHLSSAVILLASQGGSSRFSNWNQWTVAFEPEDQKDRYRCAVYLVGEDSPIMFEGGHQAESKSAFAIMARNPTLTLLGLRLAELALGQTLAQVRLADGHILDEVRTEDDDILDLLTLKKLLAQGRIKDQVGHVYESVVGVCIYQQFRSNKSGSIKQLDLNDASFLENAAVSILHPLYQDICKTFTCECYRLHQKRRRPTDPHIGLKPSFGDRSRLQESQTLHRREGNVHWAPFHEFLGHNQDHQNELSPRFAEPKSARTDSNVSDQVRRTPAGHPQALRFSREESVGDTPSRQQPYNLASPAGSHQGPPRAVPPDRYPYTSPRQANYGVDSSSQPKTFESSLLYQPKNRGDANVKAKKSLPELNEASMDDAVSESLESLTATTDSGFIWLSENGDEADLVALDHPIFVLKDITVKVLLRSYDAWRAHGMDAGENAGQSGRASHTTSKKRKTDDTWQQRVERDDDDEEDNEDGDELPGPGQSSSGRQDSPRKRIFSCPFLTRDPATYGACCDLKLKRIRDVKQHLGRRHQLPFYCPKCTQTFRDEELRDTHLRDANCDRRPLKKPEGVTNHQKKLLSRKVPASQSPSEQWYGVFDILFPGHEPRPESPYLDGRLSRQVLSFQSFWLTHGADILQEVVAARGDITLRQPPSTPEVNAFQRGVFNEGIKTVFTRWRQSEGLEETSSEQHGGLATLPFAGMATGASTVATTTTADETGEESQSADASTGFFQEDSSYAPSMSSMPESTQLFADLQIDSPSTGHPGPFTFMTATDHQVMSTILMDFDQQYHDANNQGRSSGMYGRM